MLNSGAEKQPLHARLRQKVRTCSGDLILPNERQYQEQVSAFVPEKVPTVEALAQLGRLAAKLIGESTASLETLANLVYLARAQTDQAGTTAETLAAVDAELKKITDVYTVLLTQIQKCSPAQSNQEIPGHLRGNIAAEQASDPASPEPAGFRNQV